MLNKRGFTVTEVLFAAFILSVITAILLYAISAGQVSFTLGSARSLLQAEVRRSIDWIVRDSRQSISWEIADNSPGPDHIKFRQVTGWDTANNTFLLSNYYIEYSYDSAAKTITRRTSDLSDNTIGSWILNYVTVSPFFTLNSSGNVVALNPGDLLTSKKLVISISGQTQVIGAQVTNYSLTEEVGIRNG